MRGLMQTVTRVGPGIDRASSDRPSEFPKTFGRLLTYAGGPYKRDETSSSCWTAHARPVNRLSKLIHIAWHSLDEVHLGRALRRRS